MLITSIIYRSLRISICFLILTYAARSLSPEIIGQLALLSTLISVAGPLRSLGLRSAAIHELSTTNLNHFTGLETLGLLPPSLFISTIGLLMVTAFFYHSILIPVICTNIVIGLVEVAEIYLDSQGR